MHAPGTVWRRALRRVERRALAVLAAREAIERLGIDYLTAGQLVTHTAEYALLGEAAATSNRLAHAAGIAGPLAR